MCLCVPLSNNSTDINENWYGHDAIHGSPTFFTFNAHHNYGNMTNVSASEANEMLALPNRRP
jgi:hypothetical protein